MERSLFRYILKYSKRQQLLILLITGLSLPFYYASLDVPKLIINKVLDAVPEDFPRPFEIFGYGLLDLEQKPLLYTYCGLFLFLVLINGGFKYWINVYKGIMGERMLRRLRYQLLVRALRFPLGHFRKVSAGEIIPMITSEVETLGGFIGDAMALPLLQGGLLLTAVFFIFAQDVYMGIASIALYPIQALFIPRLQRKVNLLGKARVKEVRKLSERIAESVQTAPEMHASGTARYELADFSARFGTIFDVRNRIYILKFLVKFLNNFLAQLTPFFFYSIGGWLAIEGSLSLGSLFAAIAAYKDLPGPWKELLDYYQMKEDSRIKYDQVVSQFDIPGLRDEALLLGDAEGGSFQGELQAVNLGLAEDGEVKIDGVNTLIPLGRSIAIVGDGASGKADLAQLLVRLIDPTAGRLVIGGVELKDAPEALIGQRIGYVGPATSLLATSLGENLTYGLKHRPVREVDYVEPAAARRKRAIMEAERSGNSVDDRQADWIDHGRAAAETPDALTRQIALALDVADLSGEVYQLGLKGTIDPVAKPDEARRVLEARRALPGLLEQSGLADLVEPFNPDRYNTNASVAENLLFGSPLGEGFDMEHLPENDYVMGVLAKAGLTDTLLDVGLQVARTMVELFADLPPEHEFFAQFSFIGFDELPDYQNLVRRIDGGRVGELDRDERRMLLSLPFKLVPARHRLGLIDEAMQERLLAARRAFAEGLPPDLRYAIAFFDPDRYNGHASLQDNVLFGKLAYGKAHGAAKVSELIAEVVATLGLRDIVIEAGLAYPVGIGGTRLTNAQRQKVAIARAVLKRPDILVLNEALTTLDGHAQTTIMTNLMDAFRGRTLICALHRPSLARQFDHVLVLKGGRLAGSGDFASLETANEALAQLLAAE
ncbi:MAG: ATP-binding cassette domain-containing protein [Alphaproteobacteria bacterium]|nr:ATP-binding cassette domain-containing protein [Alphaproteobacteria bacterium]